MLEALLSLFRGEKLAKLGSGLFALAPVLKHLEENYQADSDAKNAMIDTLITILQQHKDK
jgi:hypothetical protein